MAAFSNGQYGQAVIALTEAAHGGSSDAKYYLGILFMAGRGTEKNTQKALDLWSSAAEQKHPQATAAVGEYYLELHLQGKELLSRALYYFELAAHYGDSASQRLVETESVLMRSGAAGLDHKARLTRLEAPDADFEKRYRSLTNNAPELLQKGERLYSRVCMVCHATGVAGAPVKGDESQWNIRLKQGEMVLFEHAIKGYKGMPPRGTAVDAADEEILAAIRYMLPKLKGSENRKGGQYEPPPV